MCTVGWLVHSHVYMCSCCRFHGRVSQSFSFPRLSASPLPTPPCITAFKLLCSSLSQGWLIDVQKQSTSLNCVSYVPRFSTVSASLKFPFLGEPSDESFQSLVLPQQVRDTSCWSHTLMKPNDIVMWIMI